MSIVQRNSGTFNGTSFLVTPASGNFGTGTVLVVAVFGNTVVNTPSGWTQRTNSVVNMGLYSYDAAGAGQASITFTNSAGAGEWFVWELSSGSTWLTGQAAQAASAVTSYATPSITPSAGDRHILAVVGGNGGGNTRTVTAHSNSFTEWADLQVTTQDWTFSAASDRDVTTAGSTAYTTTGTFSGASDPSGVGGITLAYINASAGGALTRTVDDPAGLTDAAAPASTFARTQDDGAGLIDTQIRALDRPVTDPASLTDTASTVVAFGRTQDDPAGLTDAVTTASTFSRAQADSAGLFDAVGQALAVAVTAADAIGLTDSATPVLTAGGSALTRTVDDPAGLVDTTFKASGHVRAQDDSAGLVDLVAAVLAASRVAADAIGLTDSTVAQLNGSAAHTRTITDSAGLTSSHRCLQLTGRLGAGTTTRPNAGITSRPDAGITYRLALIPD